MYINPNKQKKSQTANPEKYPQGYFKDKVCKLCDTVFSPKAPSECYCSDACKDTAHQDKYLKRTYGISLVEYAYLMEDADNKCMICGSEGFTLNPKSKAKLVIDHDHTSGEVRGVLCHNCNRALGLFQDSKDNLSKATKYLERATTISKESTPKQVEAQGSIEAFKRTKKKYNNSLKILSDDIV